jgi:hypothetical protein
MLDTNREVHLYELRVPFMHKAIYDEISWKTTNKICRSQLYLLLRIECMLFRLHHLPNPKFVSLLSYLRGTRLDYCFLALAQIIGHSSCAIKEDAIELSFSCKGIGSVSKPLIKTNDDCIKCVDHSSILKRPKIAQHATGCHV